MARRPNSAEAKPRPNDVGTRAKPFVERIERVLEEKKVYVDGCAADVKAIYEEADESGLQPKALKRFIRLRKLERDIRALPEKLDLDQAAQFNELAAVFAEADPALSAHARLRAMGARVEVELRHGVPANEDPDEPALMNEQREDAEYLARIGRGPASDAEVIDELAS